MDNVDIKNPTLYLLDFSNEVENIKDEMRFYPNDFINLDVEFEGTLAQIHAQEKSLELAWALHPDQDQPDAEAEIRRGYERAEKLATVKLSNSEKLMQLLTQNIERLDNDFAKAGVSLEPSHDGVEEFAGNRKNKRAASRGPSPAPSTSSKQRKRHSSTPTPTFSLASIASVAVGPQEFDATQEVVSDDDANLYCFCQKFSNGSMVACDNKKCKYEWFHYGCVGISETPKGDWYCPECRPRKKRSRKSSDM